MQRPNSEVSCRFELPPPLDALIRLAAVQQLTLQDVVATALQVVVSRLSESDVPALNSGNASLQGSATDCDPSLRDLLTAGGATQTSPGDTSSEVQTSIERNDVPVGRKQAVQASKQPMPV